MKKGYLMAALILICLSLLFTAPGAAVLITFLKFIFAMIILVGIGVLLVLLQQKIKK